MIRNIFLLSVVAIIALSSCIRQRDIVYFQDIDNVINNKEIIPVSDTTYRVQVNDILYVKVFSFSDEITKLFNVETQGSIGSFWTSETNVYLNGFSVNDSGCIDLPIIGEVGVSGETIFGIQKLVQMKMNSLIKDGTVVVKLISFDVSVIGEVLSPGLYRFYRNDLNIIELIAKAGGITISGDKKNILILRPTSKGYVPHYLDLTEKDLLSAKGFELMPNDIVYVKPQKNMAIRFSSQNLSILLASISTIILVLNFVNVNK